jgi:hypothetical protein
LKELEEALMDRTTASLSRRQKITCFVGNQIIIKEVKDIFKFTRENSEPFMTTPSSEEEQINSAGSCRNYA